MECNRDEAVRAKEIAEKKMETNDFEGARKIALRAKNLYPELENITQILCICDVHCSSQKRLMGSEKDWYDILQVEKLSDESTVKKQYRRLALILHPDKNRFKGAEAAFKLICEAYALLSDPARKSLYDTKIRVSTRTTQVTPPNHTGTSSHPNKKSGARVSVPNGYNSSLNQHQETQSTPFANMETFWTSCPFCVTRFQYPNAYMRKSLCCPACKKMFVAYAGSVPVSRNKSGQKVPSKSGSAQPSAAFEKVTPTQGNNKMGSENDKGIASKKKVRPEPTDSEGIKVAAGAAAAKDVDNLKTKETDNHMSCEKKGGTSNVDAAYAETGNRRNKSRKRVRKESSESCDISSTSDIEDLTLKGEVGVHSTWKSSRKKQHVSYKEEDNLKEHILDGEDSESGYQNSFPTGAENLQGKKDESDEKHEVSRETGSNKSRNVPDETVEIESDSDQDTISSVKPGIDCPDPEFSDFEKARDETQFDVNQFWACYDTSDSMPRFYAKVKKVFKSPFELSITWLESVPIDKAFEEWVNGQLPVGCGSFKLGKTEKTNLRLSFSHQVHFEKGKRRGSLLIYPRKGEVWALFKDWDASWSSDPEKHKNNLKYEIVEVVSNFADGFGVRVVYLDRVSGFVSLFQRACLGGIESFVVVPNELYRFSHLVPSFKMTGSEREGVPVGSYELDPASLPLNPDDLSCPSGEGKMEDGKTGPGVDCSSPGPGAKKTAKNARSKEGASATTAEKFVH